MNLPNLTLVTLGLLTPGLDKAARAMLAAAHQQREAARLMKEAAARACPDRDLR